MRAPCVTDTFVATTSTCDRALRDGQIKATGEKKRWCKDVWKNLRKKRKRTNSRVKVMEKSKEYDESSRKTAYVFYITTRYKNTRILEKTADPSKAMRGVRESW